MPRRLLVAVLAAGALLALPAAAQAQSTTLVINEIDYDQTGTDTGEYIEIKNVSSGTIELDPYAVRLVNGANNTIYGTIDLPAGGLAAGEHYVICGNSANVANCDLDVTPDVDRVQNGAPDAVALIGPGDAIVDTVSYEGATAAPYTEGTNGAPADNNVDANTSIARQPDGCDSDDNELDFQYGTGTPGAANSATSCGGGPPADAAPTVTQTDPAQGEMNVPTDASLTVTFSEPVATGGDAFALACTNGQAFTLAVSSSDQTTFTLDPAGSLPRGESCTLTVRGASVSDTDANDPPDTMTADRNVTFSVAGLEGLRIHDIQGTRHRSPYEGKTVDAVPGVVTVVGPNGFWMQDPRPDRDRRTSEGIFVFRGGSPAIGTAVTVSGLVEEFRPGNDPENLTTTEISSPAVTVTGTGSIPPTRVGKGALQPPKRFIDNDSTGDVELNPLFDPWQDGIDFHESLEGMLVEILRPEVVGPTNNFGELPVVSDGAARPRSERDGVIVRPRDFNPERFILDDVLVGADGIPDANVGDGLRGPVLAVVDYSFANFKYLATSPPERIDRKLKREVTQRPDRDELSVGSMNVENLSVVPANDANAAKFARLAGILVDNMRSPDLVAIEEVQDDDGPANTPLTDATLTWEAFIAAVQAAGGPEYEFTQIDPVDDQDGGQPGGNIRVGFLYRTDRGLDFVERPGGTATTPVDVVEGDDGPELTVSPGRIEPNDPAWNASRKPLAGEFTWRGESFIAVANHFSSKGGDQPLFGRFQPPERSTEVQRHQQAALVRDFVEDALDIDRHARVIVMGDLNDFEFSETLEILEDAPMVNLMETLDRDERYSYVFEGNTQTLDQILVTRELSRDAEYDSVHVNAEFFDQASDHDPQVARLEIEEKRHGHGHGHRGHHHHGHGGGHDRDD
jgi:predicted extracellular nuclease